MTDPRLHASCPGATRFVASSLLQRRSVTVALFVAVVAAVWHACEGHASIAHFPLIVSDCTTPHRCPLPVTRKED